MTIAVEGADVHGRHFALLAEASGRGGMVAGTEPDRPSRRLADAADGARLPSLGCQLT